MVGALIIVFREVIEAGLIIGIVLAATQRSPMSRAWIGGGALAGILGSCFVAGFMTVIATSFGGFGQEILNITILATAVVMLVWHNVWMARHGRSLADDLFTAGREVVEGKRPQLALAIVVGAAILREGSEVVLFLYGVAVSDGSSVGGLATGGVIGLLLGLILSAVTYLGLVRIPTRHVFTVTSWLITFLAAGMAAQAAGFMQQAGFIDFLAGPLWDTSEFLSENSIAGRILHTLIGYSEQPTAFQGLAYILVIAAMIVLTRLVRPPAKSKPVADPA